MPDDPLSDSLQHHYNDEAIAIVVDGGTLTSLKRSGTDIPWTTGSAVPSRLTAGASTGYSLIEETKNRQLDSDLTLSSSITLTGLVSGAGTYTIKIYDVTHEVDFPTNALPVRRPVLTFTLYVVPERSAARSTELKPVTTFASGDWRLTVRIRILMDSSALAIDTYFAFRYADPNAPVNYSSPRAADAST